MQTPRALLQDNLSCPIDYPDPDKFSWERYLEETGSTAVSPEAFKVVRTLHNTKSNLYLRTWTLGLVFPAYDLRFKAGKAAL